ncbi:hypothetical protein L6E12_25010 [Actinokineospora sp. PR83]|uniref:hypothetical protein n=1 Tax=Actinokineospora sp. PR83 TaxID=2884908 RepID=UPI001F46E27F|nr:hypothetical protein [Actinokineospora sp. PR83]MCG8919045.1 hypothetical protein [Actinokineospora sp. PR83]
MREPTANRSALLVDWDGATRGTRQSADLLLREAGNPVAGWSWVLDTLTGHPGCLGCGVRGDGGDWLLVGLRAARPRGIDRLTAEELLRTAHLIGLGGPGEA